MNTDGTGTERLADTVDEVLAHLDSRPPTLGQGRLLCVDGPAGSGKTTLAGVVAERTGAPVVHMDDLFPGWDGMRGAQPHVLRLLRPLAAGETGYYRRYDWFARQYLETHHIDPRPLLVLEGVGAGSVLWAEHITTLVWVEADRDERLRRGLARDGDAAGEHWAKWMREEDDLFAGERTRSRADVVVRT